MENTFTLSARQQAVYDFIVRFYEERAYPPTVREIGEAVGLKSTSNVHAHLKTLEKKGYIRMDASRQRTISIVRQSALPAQEFVKLPVLNAGAVGSNALSFHQISGYVPISPAFLPNVDIENAFIMEAEGESMAGAGIMHGDHLLVQKGRDIKSGELAVARVNAVYGDAATVKRLFHKDGNIVLQSENSAMQSVTVAAESVEIIGKVVALFRRY